ncbi:MAG TPA: nicotinate-nucleotide adenylyltransferase [Terriglobales bacterium]|nr:nicotinate-nucleotide adenylyltransferase [Terriglobales bacterium]
MNVGLFGGTFDPIHRGHLAVARAARDEFKLNRILFVPAAVPPHKPGALVAAFEQRYAMVALATAGEDEFIPSLLEAPRSSNVLPFRTSRDAKPAPNYSISTVRKLRSMLHKNDKLFFILGVDSFLQISTWREPEALFEEAEFIIASRPGFSMAEVAAALPRSLRPRAAAMAALRKQKSTAVALPGLALHLLPYVRENVSSTAIRKAAQGNGRLERFVGEAVAEYIRKQKLYR